MSFGRVVSNCRRTHRGGGPALLPRTRPSHAARHPPRRQGVSSRSHAAAADGKKQLTAAERDAVLERANESMRAYYSYPPEKLLALKKSKFNAMHRDKTFFLQLGLGVSLLCTFILSPFIGRKIAYDDEFRKKYIPKWYDYSIEQPKSAWTREELNKHIMRLQGELHARAIAGDFAPDKLEDLRRARDGGGAGEGEARVKVEG